VCVCVCVCMCQGSSLHVASRGMCEQFRRIRSLTWQLQLLWSSPVILRVGQSHIYMYLYTAYIRYFWQGNHQIYDHIWCIYRHTVLANPTHSMVMYLVISPQRTPTVYTSYTHYITYIYTALATLVMLQCCTEGGRGALKLCRQS